MNIGYWILGGKIFQAAKVRYRKRNFKGRQSMLLTRLNFWRLKIFFYFTKKYFMFKKSYTFASRN